MGPITGADNVVIEILSESVSRDLFVRPASLGVSVLSLSSPRRIGRVMPHRAVEEDSLTAASSDLIVHPFA